MTSPFHFTNIPISASVSATPTTKELDKYLDCNEKAAGPVATLMGDTSRDCVHAQIKFFLGVLSNPAPTRNPGASASETAHARESWKDKRIVALSYLVHLVGDAHQPLHTSVSHNDAGGNAETVKFDGKLERLHEFWDDLLDTTSWKDQTPGAANKLAKELISTLDTLSPTEIASWTTDVESTVNNAVGESFNISKKTIYPEYYKLRKDQPGTKPVVLPVSYKTKYQPIAYKRLQQAGVRLAWLLNGVDWDGTKAQDASPAKP
jgi:hypothetical protein